MIPLLLYITSRATNPKIVLYLIAMTQVMNHRAVFSGLAETWES